MAVATVSIRSLLVANRGEIAVRIIRACRDLGVRAVSVYSEADRDAPHVALADDAVCIGPSPSAASYLDIGSVTRAALDTGVDAVHPGYGFLSENPAFPRALAQHGIVFVGPPADVIERMGSKQRARHAAVAAGVAVVPGDDGDRQDDDGLVEAASRVGYPLMIKAVAGGGGRGMRRVYRPEDFMPQLALARGEARSAFGDATVFLERLIERARHVEVQVLADAHGNVIHLFDRDCSLQRAHQKVIEEAPAPNLPVALRERMLGQATALARAIGYVNAGTVEFIYDLDRGEVYFLEMNTRLQVEHPVTEQVTGIDIVRWQIRIAMGEPLDVTQEDVRCHGHAIEARITAENPADGFRPGTGRVVDYAEPAGQGIRVDSGVGARSEIGHHYDALLAKVVAHGADRESARRRLVAAVTDFRILGLATNHPFLLDLLGRCGFAAVTHTTALADAYTPGRQDESAATRVHAEAALAMHLASSAARDPADPWLRLGAWRVTATAGGCNRSWYFTQAAGEANRAVCVEEQDNAYVLRVDDDSGLDASTAQWVDGWLDYASGRGRRRVRICVEGEFAWHGERPTSPVAVRTAEHALLHDARTAEPSRGALVAPMPGTVVEVLVAKGDIVSAGQTVYVLEAMKMFQAQAAPADGVVAVVHAQAGDHVDGGSVIVEIAAGG